MDHTPGSTSFSWLRAARHGWQSLRRQPRTSALKVLLLGAALTVLAPVLTLLFALVWRPLPFSQPEHLVAVFATELRTSGKERRGFSVPDFADYRAQAADAFSHLAAYIACQNTVQPDAGASVVPSELIDAHYLGTLGVQPLLGRALDA